LIIEVFGFDFSDDALNDCDVIKIIPEEGEDVMRFPFEQKIYSRLDVEAMEPDNTHSCTYIDQTNFGFRLAVSGLAEEETNSLNGFKDLFVLNYDYLLAISENGDGGEEECNPDDYRVFPYSEYSEDDSTVAWLIVNDSDVQNIEEDGDYCALVGGTPEGGDDMDAYAYFGEGIMCEYFELSNDDGEYVGFEIAVSGISEVFSTEEMWANSDFYVPFDGLYYTWEDVADCESTGGEEDVTYVSPFIDWNNSILYIDVTNGYYLGESTESCDILLLVSEDLAISCWITYNEDNQELFTIEVEGLTEEQAQSLAQTVDLDQSLYEPYYTDQEYPRIEDWTTYWDDNTEEL
jgi:hypothetical protein